MNVSGTLSLVGLFIVWGAPRVFAEVPPLGHLVDSFPANADVVGDPSDATVSFRTDQKGLVFG